MSRTLVKHALNATAPADAILLQGWVRTRRDAKAFSFIELNDGSCLKGLQLIVDASLPDYVQSPAPTPAPPSRSRGKLVASQGPGPEMGGRRRVVQGARRGRQHLPAPEKGPHPRVSPRDRAPAPALQSLWRRLPRAQPARLRRPPVFPGAGFPLRAHADHHGERRRGRGRHVPRDDARPREPAATARTSAVDVAKDFFGKKTFLTVSGQLEGEIFAHALSNIYTFGPTFRAENSHTSRHAAEFWMIEPEVAFCDLEGDMDLAEEFVKYLIRDAKEHCAADLEFFAKFVDKELLTRLDFVLEKPFVRCSYTDAVAILEKSGKTWEHPISWGANLQSEHERYLTEEHFKCPVTVYNYPRAIKAFYMRQTEAARPRQTVAAMDLLVPGIGEIIGGSQREERLDKLRAGMALHHLDEKAYWWYLDLRRYGTRAARRLRPRLRAHAHVRHRRGQHPRRDPVRAHAGHGGFLRRTGPPRHRGHLPRLPPVRLGHRARRHPGGRQRRRPELLQRRPHRLLQGGRRPAPEIRQRRHPGLRRRRRHHHPRRCPRHAAPGHRPHLFRRHAARRHDGRDQARLRPHREAEPEVQGRPHPRPRHHHRGGQSCSLLATCLLAPRPAPSAVRMSSVSPVPAAQASPPSSTS
jgi:asparaginyl-tRNA synthetase